MKIIKQTPEQFAKLFVEALGSFVKEQKKIAKDDGMNNDEINAVITTTFNLLGRNCEVFKKRAKIN